MATRHVVLIIGVGRSGTSLMTRVLSLCGCALPDALLGVWEGNPRGTWEPMEALKINHEFMFKHGVAGWDPGFRIQEIQLGEGEREDYISAIERFLGRCPREQTLVIKDPYITELMEYWREAAQRQGLEVGVVIPIRHPGEVFSSVKSLWGPTPIEFVNAFWLKRNLLAERQSRGLARVFINYSSLIEDWRREVARLRASLSLELKPNQAAIDDFIAPGLHRSRVSGPVIESFGYSWVTRVYEGLCAASRDEVFDFEALDEIYSAYRATERTLRIALEEFRERFHFTDKATIMDGLDKAPVLAAGRDF